MVEVGSMNQPGSGRNRRSQKTVVESPFTNKPTQTAHTGLFAKIISTLGEFLGGWVDFAQRWLVWVRRVTSADPKVAGSIRSDCFGVSNPSTAQVFKLVAHRKWAGMEGKRRGAFGPSDGLPAEVRTASSIHPDCPNYTICLGGLFAGKDEEGPAHSLAGESPRSDNGCQCANS